jgi:RNA polymerase sigma-70 factor (ECF subfamily)
MADESHTLCSDTLTLIQPQVRQREGIALTEIRDLERFLGDVEQRAFRIARLALRNDDDALDAVQDAMLQLAQKYIARPAEEWRPLFYRILQNKVRDCQRRRQVRSRLFAWWPRAVDQHDDPTDPVESAADTAPAIVDQLAAAEAMTVLESALASLPQRQQQAFMLRNFEGLDVAQTATAMACSEGTVKTHYSRAVHTLRTQLSCAWGGADE